MTYDELQKKTAELYASGEASNRASFYIYNTLEEVDYFLEKLPLVRKQMGFKD